MANPLEFTTATKRREPIEFTLDGETFTFTPPKTAGMVLAVIDGEEGEAKALFDWLDDGLPEDQSARLEARLRDPADDFDIEDLMEIVKSLAARASGRPTKPSSVSRRRR